MYDTVLVPTDGSDVSFTAAEEAISLMASDGRLYALAVIEELPLYKQSGKGAKLAKPDDTAERTHLDEVTSRIESMAAEAGIDCETTVTSGVPFREIIQHAGDVNADAIVLGKRGAGAAANDLLGSTTERVVARASPTVISVSGR